MYRVLTTCSPVQREILISSTIIRDINLAQQKLGWQPKISLENGLDSTIDYFRTLLPEFTEHG